MSYATIANAIRARRLVRFRYRDEKVRTVEPHLLGESTISHQVLVGWYLPSETEDPAMAGWRTYVIEDVSDVTTLQTTFDGPREGFNPQDKNIARVEHSVSVLRVVRE